MRPAQLVHVQPPPVGPMSTKNAYHVSSGGAGNNAASGGDGIFLASRADRDEADAKRTPPLRPSGQRQSTAADDDCSVLPAASLLVPRRSSTADMDGCLLPNIPVEPEVIPVAVPHRSKKRTASIAPSPEVDVTATSTSAGPAAPQLPPRVLAFQEVPHSKRGTESGVTLTPVQDFATNGPARKTPASALTASELSTIDLDNEDGWDDVAPMSTEENKPPMVPRAIALPGGKCKPAMSPVVLSRSVVDESTVPTVSIGTASTASVEPAAPTPSRAVPTVPPLPLPTTAPLQGARSSGNDSLARPALAATAQAIAGGPPSTGNAPAAGVAAPAVAVSAAVATAPTPRLPQPASTSQAQPGPPSHVLAASTARSSVSATESTSVEEETTARRSRGPSPSVTPPLIPVDKAGKAVAKDKDVEAGRRSRQSSFSGGETDEDAPASGRPPQPPGQEKSRRFSFNFLSRSGSTKGKKCVMEVSNSVAWGVVRGSNQVDTCDGFTTSSSCY